MFFIPGKLSPAPPPSLLGLNVPQRGSPQTLPQSRIPAPFSPQHSGHFPQGPCNHFFRIAFFLWFEGLPREKPHSYSWELPAGHSCRPWLPCPPWCSGTSPTSAKRSMELCWCSPPHWSLKHHFKERGTELARGAVYGWQGQWSNPDLLTLPPDFKAVPTSRLPLWSTMIRCDILGE